MIEGWASVSLIDSDGDILSPEAMRKAMKAYMKRGAPIQYSHGNRPCGTVIDYSFRNNDGNEGVYIKAKLHQGYDTDNTIWEEVKSGKLKGFSIGGIAKYKQQECNAISCWSKIPALDLFEISLCEVPSNPAAKITTFKGD